MGCGSSGAAKAADISASIAKVIFVLGGPGCGKGTQCGLLVERDEFVHLSAGDLLRAEQQTDSPDSELIKEYIKEGKIVPVEITCNLLVKAMQKEGMHKKFLIDGFPRNENNLEGWESVMKERTEKGQERAEVQQILFFELSEDIMLERIMKRAETSGRADDNEEAAKKRFTTFTEQTMKVIEYYDKKGMVFKVDATGSIEDIYQEVKKGIIL